MDKKGLAIESAKILTRNDGVSAVTRKIGEVWITDVRLSADAAKSIGRRAGRYITLSGRPDAAGMTALLRRAIMQIIPVRGRLFVAGLGNPDITQDSLGAACVRKLTARKGFRYSLSAIETDVAAKTGLETARLVKAAAREIKADCVIVIDALSCENPCRIGKTVQISDAGIIPGSGISEGGGELSVEQLGCPIAAIGVPTVSSLSAVTNNPTDKEFLVSTANIDTIINVWSEIVSGAINSLVD